MIALAILIDPAAHELRTEHEAQTETLRQAYSQIASARYAAGEESYPDATFTLRLSFGTVAGYEEDGKQVPASLRGLAGCSSVRQNVKIAHHSIFRLDGFRARIDWTLRFHLTSSAKSTSSAAAAAAPSLIAQESSSESCSTVIFSH
jgi:Peptidase S46